MNALPPKQSFTGTLWLGTGGALLCTGGLIALLSANWCRIPLSIQVIISLLPLGAAWAGYAWVVRHKLWRLDIEETLGALWAGGLVCSVALLGRVLQLASDHVAFCLLMAGMFLPVAYTLRSTFAWIGYLGFLSVAAGSAVSTQTDWLHSDAAGVGILCIGLILLLPRLLSVWQQSGLYAGTQRWFRSIGLLLFAVQLAILTEETIQEIFPPEIQFLVFLLLLSWPLVLGTYLERRNNPASRPLSLLGMITLGICFLGLINEHDAFTSKLMSGLLKLALPGVILFIGLWLARRILLRNEGLFLLLSPLILLTRGCQLPILEPWLAIIIGTAAIVIGVQTGKRTLANEGLVWILLVGCFVFSFYHLGLIAQGILFICCGIGLVALNLVLTFIAKRRTSHELH